MSPWLTALVAAAASLFGGLIVRRMAIRRGIVSDPGRLPYYRESRPLLGGMVVAAGFSAAIGIFFLFSPKPVADQVWTTGAGRMASTLFWATLYLTVSCSVTDQRQEPGYVEWWFILVSALFVAMNGFLVHQLSVPFVGTVPLGWWGVPVTVLWIVLVVSVLEALDSIGGMVALSPVLIASFVFFLLSRDEEVLQPVYAMAFVGALVGFIPCGYMKNGLLLGKGGNKVIGFLFAAVTVIARQKVNTFQFIFIPVGAIALYVVVNTVASLERGISTRSKTQGTDAG